MLCVLLLKSELVPFRTVLGLATWSLSWCRKWILFHSKISHLPPTHNEQNPVLFLLPSDSVFLLAIQTNLYPPLRGRNMLLQLKLDTILSMYCHVLLLLTSETSFTGLLNSELHFCTFNGLFCFSYVLFWLRIKSSCYRSFEIDGYEVPSKFFSDIFTPGEWIYTTVFHFTSILLNCQVVLFTSPFYLSHSIWNSLLGLSGINGGAHLAARRILLIDSLFPQLLTSQYVLFLQLNNPESYVWHPLLPSYVDGTIMNWTENTVWFKDVDTVYTPMNWGNSHWVGLVICLQSLHIQILDPFVWGTSDRKAASYMASFVKMLPYLIKAFCDPALTPHVDGTEFTFAFVKGVA